MRVIGTVVVLVYLLVGVLVANNHHYFANLEGLNGIISAILAVVLWPLILVGVNLRIGGNHGKAGSKQGAILALPWMRAIATRRRRHRAVERVRVEGRRRGDEEGSWHTTRISPTASESSSPASGG